MSELMSKSATMLTMASGSYAQTWAFCLDAQHRYATKHGLVWQMRTECCPGLNAKWSKLSFARDIIASGNDLLLIDADAEPTRRAPCFTDVLDACPEAQIFFALGNSGRPNSGVLILRGGSIAAIGLLSKCLDSRSTPVPKEDFVTSEGENGHLIHYLKHPSFADVSMPLDRLWNCTHPACAADAFIRHYTNKLGRELRDGVFVHPDDPSISKSFRLRQLQK